MSIQERASAGYRRDLGDGLVLRWSSAADSEGLQELYGFVFRREASEGPNTFLQRWVGELMSGGHPLIGPGDFALVEDTREGRVVAATCLLRQEWSYEGIAFPIGRPEVVASLPNFRNRGLVREVFGLIHARSEALGDMAQGITGIPYYYRQFGYEYAIDLGGGAPVAFASVPKLPEGQSEAYTLRPASEDDIAQIAALYERECTRTTSLGPLLCVTPISEEYWRYCVQNPARGSGEGLILQMIANAEGQSVGYVAIHPTRWDDQILLRGLMTIPGVSLLAVMPSVMRALVAYAPTLPARKPDLEAPSRISFGFGREHPVYKALGDKIVKIDPPYAWYVRVADLPAFVRTIAPVLERRLDDSFASGYTGELRITFYRGGLRLVFEQGKLASAEPWTQDHNWGPRPQAGFPPLVFLQLLFGLRSLEELRAFLPDVWAEDEASKLLGVLLPKRISWAHGLE